MACNICFLIHLVSGGPDFNGVTEEYGCRRRRLLPAVCGAADVTGGDDGNVMTHFAVCRAKCCFTSSSLLKMTGIWKVMFTGFLNISFLPAQLDVWGSNNGAQWKKGNLFKPLLGQCVNISISFQTNLYRSGWYDPNCCLWKKCLFFVCLLFTKCTPELSLRHLCNAVHQRLNRAK